MLQDLDEGSVANNLIMVEQEDRERRLLKYLNETRPQQDWLYRKVCCESSRSLYCCECCKVCIPEEDWPPAVLEGRLRFPFDIDVLLDDKERKSSSTGVQFASIAKAAGLQREKLGLKLPDEKAVNLYDLGKTDIPHYSAQNNGVYVLFPSKDSVPISTVSPEKLVVLDIKWNKQTVKFHPEISNLPKVHLDNPPAESHFWRWHNSGRGMLSTIEAIYFAVMDVTQDKWSREERDDLIHMMWLFSLQRAVIHQRSEIQNRLPPFTAEGKESQRILRVQHTGNTPKDKPYVRSSIYEKL